MSVAPEDGRSILEEAGLTKYEIDAYVTLLSLGVAEAREVCQRSSVPTSKIYNAMAHLERLGLVEVQHSRPKRFMARAVSDAVRSLDRSKASELEAFRQRLPALEGYLAHLARAPRTESTFWSVAIGWSDVVDRHLSKGAEADREYIVVLDHEAMLGAEAELGMLIGEEDAEPLGGRAHDLVEAIRDNIQTRHVRFKLLVAVREGEEGATAPWVRALVGPRGGRNARITTRRVQQFHLIDGERVIFLVPHPARPSTVLGSVFVTDKKLAREIEEAFREAWREATPVDRLAASKDA